MLRGALALLPAACSAYASTARATAPQRRNLSVMMAIRDIEQFKAVEYPDENPLTPEAFARADESPDTIFYQDSRFVTHIDDGAIGAITAYYADSIKPGSDLLDLCSSWISHLPADLTLGRVAGLGMNAAELGRNERLGEYVVQDLNANPILPFEDASFDVVTNVVSVDYLTRPLEVFKEMHRVLRPGTPAARVKLQPGHAQTRAWHGDFWEGAGGGRN